ncbi:MAG: hypothetical protein KIH10_16385 [Candidatus Freyarchaeota archaeon]|nr:hypothetical protein [Candidatus Jordarchaeia archaeon]MBS7281136.1 hypothetical protein [Candidatus Jordarchaeia archaeon]
MGLIKPQIKRIFVTCEWNRREAESVGVKVDGVIYRLCNPLAFNVESKVKVRDFCAIKNNYAYDRKNLRLLNSIIEKYNLNCEVLTDAPFVRRKLRKGVCDEDKFRWLSESRFLIHIPWNGSFEMPVFEAMACGVVPIYTKIPCLEEYAVGVGVPVTKDGLARTMDGDMVRYVVAERDVVEAVKYALGMGKEEYVDLSFRARKRAWDMQYETLGRLNGVFAGLEDFSDFGGYFV